MNATAASRPPEVPWFRDIDPRHLWKRCARIVWNYLMAHIQRGETKILVRDWEIARWCGYSLRWVRKALKALCELGVIARYRIYGTIREAGRVIEILVAPAGWFAAKEKEAKGRRSKAGDKPAGPVNSSYVPSRPATAEELEAARPRTKEEQAAVDAREAERSARAKGIWESLSEEQRSQIRGQIEKENPALRHWPAMIQAMCEGRAAELRDGGATADPRAP